MVAEECRGARLVDFAGGDPHYEFVDRAVIGRKPVTVYDQEGARGDHGCTLVTIDESTAPGDTENIGRRQILDRRIAVAGFVLGAGGFESVFIS